MQDSGTKSSMHVPRSLNSVHFFRFILYSPVTVGLTQKALRSKWALFSYILVHFATGVQIDRTNIRVKAIYIIIMSRSIGDKNNMYHNHKQSYLWKILTDIKKWKERSTGNKHMAGKSKKVSTTIMYMQQHLFIYFLLFFLLLVVVVVVFLLLVYTTCLLLRISCY